MKKQSQQRDRKYFFKNEILELKNKSEILKKLSECAQRRMESTENIISELEDRKKEIAQTELTERKETNNNKNKNEQNLQYMWDYNQRYNFYIIRITEERRKTTR